MQPFDENRPGAPDPIDGRTSQFDWDELAELLGEAGIQMDERDYEAMALGLRRILQWILHVPAHTKPERRANLIGRRLAAFAWVLDPSLFADSPSLSKLAQQLEVSVASLSQSSAAVSRNFGIRNRYQAAHGRHLRPKPRTKPVL